MAKYRPVKGNNKELKDLKESVGALDMQSKDLSNQFEDLYGVIKNDLVGSIATNRHVGLDIILSYQSLGRINTKIWGNLNQLRFHKNNESVERHSLKFPDKAEFMRIAEIMVNNEYARGNNRYFLYVDMDESKIRGNISDELREEALNQYINENYNALLKPFLVQRDGTKKKHTTETAIKEIKQRLTSAYF